MKRKASKTVIGQKLKRFLLFTLLVTIGTSLEAKLVIPSILSDNMILQRNKELNIWGKGENDQTITVTFNGITKTSIVKDGKWLIKLPKQKAGGPYKMSISSKDETINLKNILIGEVWLTAGQSNMQFTLNQSVNGKKIIANTNNSNIRIFHQSKNGYPHPTFDVNSGNWSIAKKNTLKWVSAVGYYFIEDIQRSLNIPVGIIKSAIGGTGAQLWSSIDGLKSDPKLNKFVKAYNKKVASFKSLPELDKKISKHNEFTKNYWKLCKDAKDAGKPKPKWQKYPAQFTTSFYNGMIAPLHNFPIAGVIWYQGEANIHKPNNYETLFTTLINTWRKGWNDPTMPFLFVQLPNFKTKKGWIKIREAQDNVSKKVPDTGMAVIIDLGNPKDIHPTLKKPVGERLALIAKAKVYGQDIPCSGPTYKSFKIDENTITISFDHANGLKTNNNKAPQEFMICGDDKKFVSAYAKIVDNKIVLSSEKITNPIAVRYAWTTSPMVNLFNDINLPLAPFRTDNYKK